MSRVTHFFRDLTNLTDGLDKEGTIYEIKNNKRIRGANAWMLMCSIVIASLGLDLNSPAIIIGAMLISPLMAPILGVGLGVGIADIQTIRISLQHFGIAIAIALVTSTLYFLVSPLGQITSEILSRTSPTLLDVLVAFFGGVAGIISSSRKDKSNAIPGVAIATALMPPLCVTGFGLATGNWQIMLNSFYLFFLNSFFVAMATYIIVRYLKFPTIKRPDEKGRMRGILFAAIFSIVLIVPSVFILKDVYDEARMKRQASVFVNSYFGDRKKYIDGWEIFKGDPNRIMVKVYGNVIKYADTINAHTALEAANLHNTVLEILPTSEIDLERIEKLSAEVEGISRMNEQLMEARKQRSRQDIMIDSLQGYISQIQSDSFLFRQVREEIQLLFPDLRYFGVGEAEMTDFDTTAEKGSVLFVQWDERVPSNKIKESETRIKDYIRIRMNKDNIVLLRKP